MSTSHPSGAPWRNFYGRIHGKTLKPAQQRYLAEDLPRLRVPGVGWEENPDRSKLNPRDLIDAPTWLEIGFGGGEHLVHQATQTHDVGIIRCAPNVNGVAMCLG